MHQALSAYAKLAAADLPFACAKRLPFGGPADFRAVLEDIGTLNGYAPGDVVSVECVVLFRLLADAADIFASDGFSRAYASIYRTLVQKVPKPADTKWASHHDWSRVLNGWVITARYHPRSRYLGKLQEAHCETSARAAGTDVYRTHENVPIAEAKRRIEAWASSHDVTEARIASIEFATQGRSET